MSFHLPNMTALRNALRHLKKHQVEVEDPGDEIGPESPDSPHMGIWFHDRDGYRWELNVPAVALKESNPASDHLEAAPGSAGAVRAAPELAAPEEERD